MEGFLFQRSRRRCQLLKLQGERHFRFSNITFVVTITASGLTGLMSHYLIREWPNIPKLQPAWVLYCSESWKCDGAPSITPHLSHIKARKELYITRFYLSLFKVFFPTAFHSWGLWLVFCQLLLFGAHLSLPQSTHLLTTKTVWHLRIDRSLC